MPTDHQIPPLVDALVELSRSETLISVKSKALLSTVLRKANVKVFVLPSCIYCPIVVRHSYRAAIESSRVITEIIDSSIFTDWAYRHGVMGVPKVILNDSQDITGSLEEIEFFDKLRDADHALINSMFR